jgi:putative RecB family exonuclease
LTGRPYLSYSAISTYQACSLRYYFRYVAQLAEQRTSASLVFGTAIHRALEFYYREILCGNTPPDVAGLLDTYAESWTEHDGPPIEFGQNDTRESLDGLAQRMLTAFLASEFSKPPVRVLGIEEELTGHLLPDVPPLLARIDLLIEQSETLVLRDFKTARSRWSDEQAEMAASQLLLYQPLVAELVGDRPLRLEFLMLTKTKAPEVLAYPVTFSRQQLQRQVRIVQHVWQAITRGVFFPSPSPMQCPGCPFQTACRQWQGDLTCHSTKEFP